MEYYCVMVRTGAEGAFKERAMAALKDAHPEARLFFFTHTLRSNRGESFERPVFPGYVFLQVERLTAGLVSALRRVDGFFRILRENSDPREDLRGVAPGA